MAIPWLLMQGAATVVLGSALGASHQPYGGAARAYELGQQGHSGASGSPFSKPVGGGSRRPFP